MSSVHIWSQMNAEITSTYIITHDKKVKITKMLQFFDAILIMFDWAAEELLKPMFIFKCIVIVCDLKVVHKNCDNIWKEHIKLTLLHFSLSNFFHLHEYTGIVNKHLRSIYSEWRVGKTSSSTAYLQGKAQLISSIHVQEWKEIDDINTVDLYDNCTSYIITILRLSLHKAYNIV